MSRLPRIIVNRRLVTPLAAALLLLATAGAGAYLYYQQRTGSIYDPHARFVNEAPPTLPTRGPGRSAWPLYGYSKEHTRNFPAAPTLHPPYTVQWVYKARALLEFPPVVYGRRIFQLDDRGILHAVQKTTGYELWQRRIGTLAAASPAASGDTVYATVLQRAPAAKSGRVVALRMGDGKIAWTRDVTSRTESSPLLDRGKLYVGSENGTVYALDAHSGRVLWTYHASGAVKSSPTLHGGRLYFGDYSGHVQAVSAQDGHRIWRAGTSGRLFGSGNFYATAAVVYGRVFLGNTDGRMYAFDEGNGHLDWARQTGNYVYSSSAVADAPGLGPTVYVGSYDGTLYALDARSGSVRWTYHSGGKISGGVTVVGRIVYFADLGRRRTIGLGISTGVQQMTLHSGTFDPVVSDGQDLYVTGYASLRAFAPRVTAPAAPARHPAARHVRRRHHGARPHRGRHHRVAHRARHRRARHHRVRRHRARHHPARHHRARRHRARHHPARHRRAAHHAHRHRRAHHVRRHHQRTRRAARSATAAAAQPPVLPRASRCASRFLVSAISLASGACGASGEASGTG